MIDFLKTPLKYLDDFHKKKSSKRLWGCRAISVYFILGVMLFFICLLTPIIFNRILPSETFEQCESVIISFRNIGAALLFGGLLERCKFNFGKK